MEIEPADTEVDYSVIRDPIFTSVRSLDDYINVMSIGTPEIKRIISEECDVILECKCCQSLFRSLPNFIAHKRVYCKKKFGGYLPPVPSHVTEDETLVLEPTDPADDAEKDKDNDDSDVRPLFESVLDGSYEGSSMGYKVFTDALVKEQTMAEERDTTIVSLDSIPGNPNAMFQAVDTVQGKKTDEELATISKNSKRKREAEERLENIRNKIVKIEPQSATHSHVKFALRNRKGTDTEEDSAGKTKDSPPSKQGKRHKITMSGNEWKKHVSVKTLTCNICEQKYACLKTLRFHVESFHQEKRRFYPCPLCNALFSQVWGTRRHVERRHEKSREQWVKMAEDVKRMSFTVPMDELDENGRPKNYELSKQKKNTRIMSMAAKSKGRAVANLKKAAEKRSVKPLQYSESDTSEDSSSDNEPLANIGSKSAAMNQKDKLVKKHPEGSLAAAKKSSTPTVLGPLPPGKTLKVKVDKDGKEISKVTPRSTPVSGSVKKSVLKRTATLTSDGKKLYKCSNCSATYDIKGSLNKHINRGRCFKKVDPAAPSRVGKGGGKVEKVVVLGVRAPKSSEKPPAEKSKSPTEKTKPPTEKSKSPTEKSKSPTDRSAKDAKKEALASVLSPKQLRKVNALMDRDKIKCLQCKKQFTALILLSRHVIRHLGIVRYKCKFCLYKSFNQGECMKHVRNSHNKNDAHKFVLNIDKDTDEAKNDASCRGLSSENGKYTKKSSGDLKTEKNKSPASSGASSGEPPTSPGGTPTFNLHVAKRLFCNTAKSGDEAEYKPVMVKDEPPSPPGSRPGSIARSNSVCSTNSDRVSEHKSGGMDSNTDPNSKNYNISTRNSPRMFDTTPYKRDGMSSLTTRHGTYEKTRDGSSAASSSDESGSRRRSDGYTTIKNLGNKTPPRDAKTAEQIKKEKDSSTEKLLEEIFG